MSFLNDSKLRAGVVFACLAVAGSVAAYYGAGAMAASPNCEQAQSCIVAGAEVDDEATIKARRLTGTGPASGILADKRMASDVVVVGQLENGFKVYSFTFLFEDKVRIGVLAQDLTDRPDTRGAVLAMANGLLGVDYNALGLRMATEAQWKQSGLAALKADYKPQGKRSAALDEPVKLTNGRVAR